MCAWHTGSWLGGRSVDPTYPFRKTPLKMVFLLQRLDMLVAWDGYFLKQNDDRFE